MQLAEAGERAYDARPGQRVVCLDQQALAGAPRVAKPRVVPMTIRLKEALVSHRHLRGDRVLYRAGLRPGGRVRILRHTLCSRLAARNVPLLSIKELAGHQSPETPQRYMNLSSAAPREAIRALELGGGELGETSAGGEKNGNDAA